MRTRKVKLTRKTTLLTLFSHLLSLCSTPEQIRAEYLKRVKGVHPDGQGTAAAAHDDGFTALQTAYGVLGDPRRRAHYDQWRLSGLSIPFKQFCNVSEDVVQVS